MFEWKPDKLLFNFLQGIQLVSINGCINIIKEIFGNADCVRCYTIELFVGYLTFQLELKL
jgi:hypothetical protein